MRQFEDLIYQRDLAELPREALRELATSIGLPTSAKRQELSSAIWRVLSQDNARRRQTLALVRNRVFAAKTSATWYRTDLSGEELARKASDLSVLSDGHTFDGGEDEILAAAKVEDAVWFRCLIHAGVRERFQGLEPTTEDYTEIGTAKLDLTARTLEVRARSIYTRRIAGLIAQALELPDTSPFELIRLITLSPEKLCDLLDGQILEADSTLQVIMDMLTDEQLTSVRNVLDAVTAYLDSGDLTTIEPALSEARDTLKGLHPLPFMAIAVSGMRRMGLVGTADLRGQPLFAALRPYLGYRSGFIKFQMAENGIETEQTIRVAIASDSVYFMSAATEQVIRYVVERLPDAMNP